MFIDLAFLKDKDFWFKFMDDCSDLINEFPKYASFSITNKCIEEYLLDNEGSAPDLGSTILKMTISSHNIIITERNPNGDFLNHLFFFPASSNFNYVAIESNPYRIKPGLYSKRRFIAEDKLPCYGKQFCFPKYFMQYPRRNLIATRYAYLKTKNKKKRITLDWLYNPDHVKNSHIACYRILKMSEEKRYFLFLGIVFLLDQIIEARANNENGDKEMIIQSSCMFREYSKRDQIDI